MLNSVPNQAILVAGEMVAKRSEVRKEKVVVYDVKEFDKTLYRRAIRAVTGKARLHPIDDLEE